MHALVKDRHGSREFIEFLGLLDAAYPAATAITIILDNHSAHISTETEAWPATRAHERFQFVFTPKLGPGSILSRAFLPKPRAPSFVTSASTRNTN